MLFKVVIDEKLIEKLMPNDEQIIKHFNNRGNEKRKEKKFAHTSHVVINDYYYYYYVAYIAVKREISLL